MEPKEIVTQVTSKWCGGNGDNWDHGFLFEGVKEISVSLTDFISSIDVVYYREGDDIAAHGGTGSVGTNTIKLKSDEYLIEVSGHCDHANSLEGRPIVITSLKFKTNSGTYGPFGEEKGKQFTLTVNYNAGERIVGFFGRSGKYLDAIGVHLTTAKTPNTVDSPQAP